MIRVWLPAAIALALAINVTQTAGHQVLSAVISHPSSKTKTVSPGNPDLESYRGAIAIAERASLAVAEADKASDRAQKLNYLKKGRFFWESALEKLDEISPESDLATRAALRRSGYEEGLATAISKLDEVSQNFVADIVAEVGVGDRAHVTLCHIQTNDCRSFQGDQPMASAASLIKLPIAIALINKVIAEDISLDDTLFIEPGNFTESSAGAIIETGKEYPLRKVMGQMIQESDNIATNQLIDYLGYEAMNKTMRERGYQNTLIGHKLIGAEAAPVDFGDGVNQSTTNDITAMMVNIYSLQRPGDDEILTALSNQQDWELGYEALKDVRLRAKWLGEKTGQNDLVIATTLAIEIEKERYVLTVAIDDSAGIYPLRDIVGAVAQHLVKHGL